jgi:hypothetical protein
VRLDRVFLVLGLRLQRCLGVMLVLIMSMGRGFVIWLVMGTLLLLLLVLPDRLILRSDAVLGLFLHQAPSALEINRLMPFF